MDVHASNILASSSAHQALVLELLGLAGW